MPVPEALLVADPTAAEIWDETDEAIEETAPWEEAAPVVAAAALLLIIIELDMMLLICKGNRMNPQS